MRVASIYSIGLSEMSRLQEEFSLRYPDGNCTWITCGRKRSMKRCWPIRPTWDW